MADHCVVESLLLDLKLFIHKHLEKDDNVQDIDLRKKSKDLKHGDFILPKGCIRPSKKKGDPNDNDKILAGVEDDISTHDFVARVNQNQDKFNLLAIFLNRASTFKAVFQEIEEKGLNYGSQKNKSKTNCVVLNIVPETKKAVGLSELQSLNDLRCSLVYKHLYNILKAHGYEVILLKQQSLDPGEKDTTNSALKQSFIRKAYNIQDDTISREESSRNDQQENIIHDHNQDKSCASYDTISHGDCEIELQKVICENGFVTGKDGFDKNLNSVSVVQCGALSETAEDVLSLEEAVQGIQSDKSLAGCVHIVPLRHGFGQQKVHLLWSALSDTSLSQSHLLVGPVRLKSDPNISSEPDQSLADQFQKLRLDQMTEAAEARYGEAMADERVKDQVSQLTQASIVFDFLQNSSHVPLHLSSISTSEGLDSRTGAFVMYNTARLATLLDRFAQGVAQGTYPQLPPLKDCDFSLLREEAEWEMLFLYISRFPDVVAQSVECVIPSGGTIGAKVHTHKVAGFLVSFSKHLSSYYSRYHILGGGEKHLLPLMFARLHFMQGAHQVLVNALVMLGLQPLDHL